MQLERPPLESLESYEDEIGANDKSEPENPVIDESDDDKQQ